MYKCHYYSISWSHRIMNYQQCKRKSLYQSIYFHFSAQGFWQITSLLVVKWKSSHAHISRRTASPSPSLATSTFSQLHFCSFKGEKSTYFLRTFKSKGKWMWQVTRFLFWKTNTWGKQISSNRCLFSKRICLLEGESLGTMKTGEVSGWWISWRSWLFKLLWMLPWLQSEVTDEKTQELKKAGRGKG